MRLVAATRRGIANVTFINGIFSLPYATQKMKLLVRLPAYLKVSMQYE
jgi:hypothetical protein